MSGTTPRLWVDRMPEEGEVVERWTLDCKWSTTGLYFLPGKLNVPESALAGVVMMTHQKRCGRCNLERLWRQRGDLTLRDKAEEAWQQFQALVMQARRN